MPIRHYNNTSAPVALTAAVTAAATSLPVTATSAFPDEPFTIAIERGVQANEEICLVTAVPDGTTLTVERGYDETTAKPHEANKPVEHCVTAQDYREANAHALDASMHQAAPSGVVLPWAAAAASVPVGWLLCDGAAYSRATYPTLHNLLKDAQGAGSYPYGAGDGSTTFNVPDLRGRMVLGKDNMGGSSANRVTNTQADAVGGFAGAEAVTIDIAHMPSHTHIQNAHLHVTNPHFHAVSQGIDGSISSNGFRASGYQNSGTGVDVSTFNTDSKTVTVQNTIAVNQSTGGGAAHNNMPPYLVLNYIIKA